MDLCDISMLKEVVARIDMVRNNRHNSREQRERLREARNIVHACLLDALEEATGF